MKSVFIIVWSNIKRRKVQSALLGLSFMVSAFLFSTTLGLFKGSDKPFDLFFDQQNASHLLISLDHGRDRTKDIMTWFENQPEVENVGALSPNKFIAKPLIFKGEEIDLMLNMTEHHQSNLVQDKILIKRGKITDHPQPGSIWIPSHLAENHHITVGDTIGIPIKTGLFPLIVSATIYDPHYNSNLFNPTRVWVSPGSLSFYFSLQELKTSTIGVRIKEAGQINEIRSRFEKDQRFEGTILDYFLFKSVFMSFYQILNAILMVFSILAIIASMIILYVSLSGSILSEYKNIGISKVLGFTPSNISSVYLIQNLLIAGIAIPIGLIGSIFSINFTMGLISEAAGISNVEISLLNPLFVSFVLFLFLIIMITYFASFKVARLKPIIAIKKENEQKKKIIPFKNLIHLNKVSIPAFLGIRLLFSNRKRSIYTGLSILLSIFILVFATNISFSFQKLKDNKSAWGLEDSDLIVSLNKNVAIPIEHQQFTSLLRNEKGISDFIPFSYTSASILSKDETTSSDINGKVYSEGIELLGLNNLEGKHPRGSDELSLCVLTAKETQKRVGDSIQLFIEGQSKTFEISGIYQDVSNLGRGFRIHQDAISYLNPLYEPTFYAIRLGSNMNIEEFKSKFQQYFGETVNIELSVEERKGIQSTISGMRNSLLIVSIFFLSIIFVILYNDTFLTTHNFERSFGILKAIGLYPIEARSVLIYKSVFLTIICLTIGIPVSLIFSPLLINSMTSGLGLEEFPYLINLSGILLIIPGMLFFTLISTWWASSSLSKITVKNLIIE